jgi:propionyl-CoA synthetase
VGTPDPGAFWRVIAQHGVNAMFTAPTAFRAIKKEDPQGVHIAKHDLRNFRTLFLAGERCDPDTLLWARDRLQVPVVDHWWQTETAWAIAANCVGLGMLPVKPGSPTKAVPGYDVRVLGEDNQEMAPGQIGSIAIKLPMPPACLPTLWNNDAGYEQSYLEKHPGHYLTGDAGYRDGDGYLAIMSRTDDIINVAGHRLSTGGMEEVLAAHPDVAECAVVGVADDIKGEIPVGFVVTKAGVDRPEAAIVAELVEQVRATIAQDPPGHHEEDRRGGRVRGARHHRRSGHPGGDRRRPPRHRLPPLSLLESRGGAPPGSRSWVSAHRPRGV